MVQTAFGQSQRDYGRLDTNLRKSIVDEVLPEHFREDYPVLIDFIEAYYEHLDSGDNFGGIIEELQTIRDYEDTDLERLNLMFDEIALGVSQTQFTFPREAIRNFGNFFRVKGSEYSVNGFFRGFFNEEIEIIYPKERLFRVGNSTIGIEDAYKLQDGALNQIFSILIRSPITIDKWETLYRNFVHPSGFYLGAEVVLEGLPKVTIGTAQSVVDLRANITNVYSTASMGDSAQGEVIGMLGYPEAFAPLYDGLDSDRVNPDALPGDPATFKLRDRYSLYRNLNDYQNLTIQQVMKYYDDLYEWGGFYASFDDYADSSNASAIRFSSTLDDYSARVMFRK